jgi:hypothetical protein
MTTYDAHYRTIESGLNQLLSGAEVTLTSKEIREVREFIDAREYGLALETLAAILDERDDAHPSFVSIDAIEALAQRMGIVREPAIAGLIARKPRRPVAQ